jgi:hypothetical protein
VALAISLAWLGALHKVPAEAQGRVLPDALSSSAAPGAPPGAAPVAAEEVGAALRVSVLTFGQGHEVFELFGHNALRIQNLITGEDLAYNWGMFSFDEPNFLGRFLSGDTRYWVEAFPTPWLLEVYAKQNRETQEQELALTPAQRLTLDSLVRENAREENRYYRYDYFLDNCSTRLRDALNTALGGALERRFVPINTEWTYRSESVRLTAEGALAQAGIDVALGPRADEPITAWQSMFIPMRLRDYLRDVTVPTADGRVMPLVLTERELYHAEGRAPELTERRGLVIGAWGPILGAWMLILAPVSAAARRRTRIPAAVMALLWYGATGAMGIVLFGMWVGSAHVFWYQNWNLLLLSPLGVVAAVPVMLAVLRGHAARWVEQLAAVIVGLALFTLLVSLFTRQTLGGPLLLFLPAHIGLAIAVWRHTRPLPKVAA